jgi:hypothetical protein
LFTILFKWSATCFGRTTIFRWKYIHRQLKGCKHPSLRSPVMSTWSITHTGLDPLWEPGIFQVNYFKHVSEFKWMKNTYECHGSEKQSFIFSQLNYFQIRVLIKGRIQIFVVTNCNEVLWDIPPCLCGIKIQIPKKHSRMLFGIINKTHNLHIHLQQNINSYLLCCTTLQQLYCINNCVTLKWMTPHISLYVFVNYRYPPLMQQYCHITQSHVTRNFCHIFGFTACNFHFKIWTSVNFNIFHIFCSWISIIIF